MLEEGFEEGRRDDADPGGYRLGRAVLVAWSSVSPGRSATRDGMSYLRMYMILAVREIMWRSGVVTWGGWNRLALPQRCSTMTTARRFQVTAVVF